MPLSRDHVVHAAVALLDDVGLEGLTLRRLASDLGVAAPTLYWHVRHKRELLDLMAEAIIAAAGSRSGSPAPGQAWEDWLAEQGRIQWRALVSHRDAARVVAGNRPTESSLPVLEETLGSLVAVGFSAAEAMENLFALGHYVLGCALEYHAEQARQRDVAAVDGPAAPQRYRGRPLPHLQAAIAQRSLTDPAASFDHGLRLLIAGMAMRLTEGNHRMAAHHP